MKKVLFIHDAEKMKIDNRGILYTDGSYNEKVWRRYIQDDNQLKVITRKENKIYDCTYASTQFQRLNDSIDFIPMEDTSSSFKNLINIKAWIRNLNLLESEIKKNDVIIVRVPNFYSNCIMDICNKYGKRVLVEVVGCPLGTYWNYGIKGKFLAIPEYFNLRKTMKKSMYSVYVTKYFLQKRYPYKGKSFFCSDVEIVNIDQEQIKKRISKINGMNTKRFVIGTIGSIDVKYKGQEYVIKAINELRKKGIYVVYEIVGGGHGNELKRLVQKLNLQNQVRFQGSYTHDKVLQWLDSIDIYVHPSLQEGLSRSIIEAMSRGCPVLASEVGGNPELIEKSGLVKKGSVKDISKKLETIKKDELIQMSKVNIKRSLNFRKEKLDFQREKIYKDFFQD